VLAVPGMPEAGGEAVCGRQRPVEIRQILAPLDFSSPSLDALEYAVQLANGLGAGSHVDACIGAGPLRLGLRAGRQSNRRREKRDHWNKQLAELRTFATSFGLAADVEIAGGIASDAILASALRHRSDLIVMGTHGRSGLSAATIRQCGGCRLAAGDMPGP
jgi:nucleotide-binding universal stress UspA family protein